MDERVRRYLENKAGVSLRTFPVDGIAVRESPMRTDERGNRIVVQRVAGWNGVLVTVEPGRAGLSPGHSLDGPAIVDDVTSTTFVPAGWLAEIDDHENLIMRRSGS